MRFVRYTAVGQGGGFSRDGRDFGAQIEQRRAIRAGTVAAGTLACARCDAPIAVGPDPRAVTDLISCPFCGQQGCVRDFLSLATPTRPAHVVVRVALQ